MTVVPPKIVCVDLGGVVIRICRSWTEGCANANVPPRGFVEGSEDSTRQLRHEAVDRYQRGLTAYSDFLDEISTIFGGMYSPQEIGRIHDGWILGDYPGVAELLAALQRDGIRVACLSNTNDSHWKQMQETSSAFGVIETRHASHLLGLNKPDPAIFAAFEKSTGCTPSEIFFADDLIENIRAAAARGWDTLHIDHEGDPAQQIADALAKRGVVASSAASQSSSIAARPAIPSPLMTRTLCRAEQPGGIIKVRSADFLVDELPLYEPSGEGEHLYLGIQKENMPHDEMLRIIADHFNVDPSSIGTAGRKDRHAVTRQAVSVNLPGKEPPTELTHDRMLVLWSLRHGNKLRTGHLAGNRFAIRVREVDPLQIPVVYRRLQKLTKSGVPNGFGEQRFGQRLDNHLLGRMVLEENWDGIIEHLTGTSHPIFPEHQRAARSACDAGEWSASVPLWGAGDHAERRMALAKSRGWTSSRSVKSLGGATLRFWVNALQSAIFNRVVDDRIAANELDHIRGGDIAYRHEGGACFVVDASEPLDSLNARAMRFEISPTGPMFGEKMLAPGESVAQVEANAARTFASPPELFTASSHPPSGERRPLRIFIQNAALDSGIDEFGGYIRIAFDLPPGAFATTVLKELFGPIRTSSGANSGANSGLTLGGND